MHCGTTDAYIDIIKFAKRLEILDRVLITSLVDGVQIIPSSDLNNIYNACDVGINTSVGEGFSLTNMEHAITGAPQIVPNHSALHEIYQDCGMLINTSYDWLFTNIMTMGRVVTPEMVAGGLETLYQDKGLYEDLSRKGIAKFSSPEYDWNVIGEQWDNLFEEYSQ
jgi:glycosyltransferase involved in cell wall biosynthesis